MPNANFLDVLDVKHVEAYLEGTNKVFCLRRWTWTIHRASLAR